MGTDKISLPETTFVELQSLRGNISKSFAIVNNSSAVDSSKALVVYNSQNGTLNYNADSSDIGGSRNRVFAQLESGLLNLTGSDFTT